MMLALSSAAFARGEVVYRYTFRYTDKQYLMMDCTSARTMTLNALFGMTCLACMSPMRIPGHFAVT